MRAESGIDEADALEDLGDEIATLAAHIHAATQRFLVLIAEFDRRRGWESGGHRSCAHWLSYRTGIDLGACREKVRTARVLDGLPETSAAMARGELSFSAVRALSRVATAENEGDLLELARGCTIAQLERTVRSWKRFSRMEEAELEQERYESRSFSVFPDDDGMYVVKGRLPAEVGALLMRALDAASDTLYRGHPTGRENSDSGRSHLEDGTRVAAETSRRLSCDCGQVTMTHDAGGPILNVGRKTRTISPALRRALDFRDRGCRFPGCGLRFTDAHHIKHWADGGETSLGNCLLLCSHHHRLLHEGGWQVTWWGEGNPCFFDPRGEIHFDGRWKPPELPKRSVEVMIEANLRQRRTPGGAAARTSGHLPAHVPPDGSTAGARWKREADIPDDIYFRALEAMG